MSAGAAQRPIGPGCLVLVVGPSGGGKDSLIRAARERLGQDDAFVFPRRMVTRPPSEAEDNQSCTPDMFARVAAAGGFAVSWRAHGLSYGIPRAIDFAIMEGRNVVCNVSRSVVPDIRRRYGNVLVIEVTAPPAILAARLAARARPEDGPVEARLRRAVEAEPVHPDVTIVNAGSLSAAIGEFLSCLNRPPVLVPSAVEV